MLLTQLFLADLPPPAADGSDGAPAVVNISSVAGVETTGYGSPEYAAAKAGLIRFTNALADPTTRRHARVMAVVPGWIGLERAREEWQALPEAERAALPPLIPPSDVVRVVLDLVASGRPGEVVELTGG